MNPRLGSLKGSNECPKHSFWGRCLDQKASYWHQLFHFKPSFGKVISEYSANVSTFQSIKLKFYRKILLVLTMEITSACLDFPRVSKIIPGISSVSLNGDTSTKAENPLQAPDEKAGTQPEQTCGFEHGQLFLL